MHAEEKSIKETLKHIRKLRKKIAKNKITLSDIQSMKNKDRK